MFNEPGPYNMDMSGAYRICIDPDFDMDFPIGRCWVDNELQKPIHYNHTRTRHLDSNMLHLTNNKQDLN